MDCLELMRCYFNIFSVVKNYESMQLKEQTILRLTMKEQNLFNMFYIILFAYIF